MERYGIGVDLGGTKILAGIVELETGKILASAKKRARSSLASAASSERREPAGSLK